MSVSRLTQINGFAVIDLYRKHVVLPMCPILGCDIKIENEFEWCLMYELLLVYFSWFVVLIDFQDINTSKLLLAVTDCCDVLLSLKRYLPIHCFIVLLT